MSRSSRPPSSIAENPAPDDNAEPPSSSSNSRRPARRTRAIRIAAIARWLHIYMSMFGLATVLFFSVTGLTLNHPDWFFANAQSHIEAEGQVDTAWLALETPDGVLDPSLQVDRLEIVEHLRNRHGIRASLADFRIDDYECNLSFRGPGYTADAFIDRETGRYQMTETYQGTVAVLNDLHKGRDTSTAWSVVIDLSAILLTIISLTGLLLLFYLKLRRTPGLTAALVGVVLLVVVGLLWV